MIAPRELSHGGLPASAAVAGEIGWRRNPPWPDWALIGASAGAGLLVIGAVALGVHAWRNRRASYPWPRPIDTGVPMAEGFGRPVWPVAATSRHARRLEVAYRDVHGKIHGNMSRRFTASRDGRFHVGIDLYANAGDPVLAPEDGKVVQIQSFLNGTDMMMVQGNHGITVLLGEIAPGSWKEFGVQEGSTVVRGQPVARVGLTDNESHMLHVETYACCPDDNEPWYKSKARPELIRDPTDYLLRAMAVDAGAKA